METFTVKIDKEQKEFIERALLEKVNHNKLAEPLLVMFEEARPTVNRILINDFTS